MRTNWKRLFPTIYYWEIGKIDNFTPQKILGSEDRYKQLKKMEQKELPYAGEMLCAQVREDGVIIKMPVLKKEKFYGLGLQMYSFCQNGKRKRLCVNADAPADTGDSHAPVPFFVSTEGYGILIDSARHIEIDFGGSNVLHRGKNRKEDNVEIDLHETTDALYKENQYSEEITIYVRGAGGIGIYCFAAGAMKAVVEQYNLFCGGGCMPPIWGLGNLYRMYTRAEQKDVEKKIMQFREEKMPFSMIGLEPGWHSHAYSCSFKWDSERFPKPQKLIALAEAEEIHLNIWEQAYIHSSAPFYEDILPYSGDYEVWEGAVPDFVCKEAVDIYGKRQQELFEQGIDAVKLDECDGADYTGGWFFPDYAKFPSGLGGEEEKSLFGAMAVRAIEKSFENLGRRTWSQVRANYSYAAPMPYILYSDLYDHEAFVRGMCNAGFSGLLWSPEVRQCASKEEFIRRLQTVVFSPLSLVNAWMIPEAPWKQPDIEKNKKGIMLGNFELEERTRELLELRNQMIPYLYTTFYQYWKNGTPPFRALCMEFCSDIACRDIDDCYMMGDALLVAPVIVKRNGKIPLGRDVYLPEGEWFDFWTDKRYEGGRKYYIETERIPVFVRGNEILAMAEEKESPHKNSRFSLNIKAYGKNPQPLYLIEDDGESMDFKNGNIKCLALYKKDGTWHVPELKRYCIKSVKEVI